MTTTSKKKVFLSYSRFDHTYRDDFKKHFQGIGHYAQLIIDSDFIHAGGISNEIIKEEISAASAFVFLISSNFISSEECKKELIFAATHRTPMKNHYNMFMFLLEECVYKEIPLYDEIKLGHLQFAGPYENTRLTPLNKIKKEDVNGAWVDLINKIHKFLQ